jgi:hypothetical protein
VKRGEIPSLLLGGRRLFPIKAVENHLAALAYASSGALDSWERNLVKATSNRLRIGRRRVNERARHLRRQLAQQRAQGITTVSDATALRALIVELDSQQALGEATRTKLMREIETIERANEKAHAAPDAV